MDNSSIPPTIKPFREALPQINKEYIQNLPGLRISDEETKKQREARVKKFDTPKIEQEEPPIKAPTKAEENISKEDETPNTPKDSRLSEIEKLTILQLGELLMKNNVKGPNNQPYTIGFDGKRILLSGKQQLKQPLSERVKQAYNDGLISNFSYTSKTK
jgi:hypothetical protein